MSSSPVAPVTVAPVAPTAAALRAQILGAAETELIAMLGAVPDPQAPAAHNSATPAAPANPVTQAVDTARTTAAGQQASLAPLFADLAETLSSPNLPTPIRAAIAQVLALRLPADGPIAPEDVRQAIAQSGLFLEADLAAPGAPPPPDLKAALLTLKQALPAPAPPPTQTPVTQAETPAQAPPSAPPAETVPPNPHPPGPVALAGPTPPVAQAQIPQVQTAPVSPAAPFAEPEEALTPPVPPVAAEATPSQVPPPATPASSPAPAPVLPQAAAVPASRPLESGAPSAPAPAPLDPKTALLNLQQAPPERPAADAPADPPPRDLRAALLSFQQAARESGTADTPSQPQRPAPPTRDAALTPQAPAPATLPEHAELSALVEHLAPQVEQALARLTLHQLASLPDGGSSAWMFELPLATPQGTAMAQFEVERDGAGSGAGDASAPWRARFSIDIEPLGPVHVHLAMTGGKAAVSVWAERADSLAWLRGQGAELAGALPAEVVFRAGTPGGVAPARGHFLDQTS